MLALSELNPKVGDTVLYHPPYPQNCDAFVVEETPAVTYRWSLRPVGGGAAWWPNSESKLPVWTLKPKESKVTVADLNLSSGDRVQLDRWTGTVTDINNQYVEVRWDWSTVVTRFEHSATPSLTPLPKPEPTLADLDLKEGDPVLNTSNNRCALVYRVDATYVCIRYSTNDTLTLFQTDPISRLKKLEVPK
jgi:hypothetical protein